MVTRLSTYYFLVTVLLAHREAWSRSDQIFLETAHINHFIRYMIHKLHQQLCVSHAYHSYVDVIHNRTSTVADTTTLITRTTGFALITFHSPSCGVAPGAGVTASAITGSALHVSAAKTTVTLLYVLRVWYPNVH